jgi:hypothetical protein
VPQAGAGDAQPATPPCHTKGATQVQQPKGGGVAPATGTPKRPPVIMGRMASPRPHAMVLHPHAPGEPCLVGLDGKVVV